MQQIRLSILLLICLNQLWMCSSDKTRPSSGEPFDCTYSFQYNALYQKLYMGCIWASLSLETFRADV